VVSTGNFSFWRSCDLARDLAEWVQKEALFFWVPGITLREETEWGETVEAGWNTLVGCDPRRIVQRPWRRGLAGRLRGLTAMAGQRSGLWSS